MLEDVLFLQHQRRGRGRHHDPADADFHRRGLRRAPPVPGRARGHAAEIELTAIDALFHGNSSLYLAHWLLGAYSLRPRRAIDRRQPKSGPPRRARDSFPSSARRHPMRWPGDFGPCGVGNGNDFKRPSARSIHLRRRAVEAGPVRRHAVGRRYPLAHYAQHPPQYPDRRFGHGHRDRSPYGDRHGAGRRHRRHPPQSRARRAGRAGAAGEEIRIRHGGEPGHHSSRCDARRCAGADAGEPHFRHSGGRGRRQRPEPRPGQARRHPHQSRRALCHRQAAKSLRADDQGAARHGARKRRPGRGQAAPASASHREASGRRWRLSLRRPHHREGHREGGGQSQCLQGRAGPAARRRRHLGRRSRLRAQREA